MSVTCGRTPFVLLHENTALLNITAAKHSMNLLNNKQLSEFRLNSSRTPTLLLNLFDSQSQLDENNNRIMHVYDYLAKNKRLLFVDSSTEVTDVSCTDLQFTRTE
ncbi:hypothetical protein J6590_002689 [Homalodisca vitripennis]|nr:hypothetical protein J6590_002689 [Homalodisca vitripennis]